MKESEAQEPDRSHSVRVAWKRVACVAGVFSFIVLLVMAAGHAHPRAEDPLDSPELKVLKLELAKNAADEDIKSKIREHDLHLRRDFFRRRRLNKVGAYLLLAGLAVFITGLKRKQPIHFGLPDEPDSVEVPDDKGREARLGRFAVVALGLLLSVSALYLSFGCIDKERDFESTLASSEDTKPAVPPRFPTREEIASNWPRFRGPDGRGISTFPDAPTSWDGESQENIVWKRAIPLPGDSSPVVWCDRIFLTGGVILEEEDEEGGRRGKKEFKERVYCLDAATGNILWQKKPVVRERRPKDVDVMERSGYAACTPVVDGQRVYAMFANGYVACIDFEGNQQWARSMGPFQNSYGHAASLVTYEKLLLLLIDEAMMDDAKSRLVALDALTGKTVWETPRAVDSSWTTPIVARTKSGPQIICSAAPMVAAYDPASGQEIWHAKCVEGEVTPSPVFVNDLVFAVHADAYLNAIPTDRKGEIKEDQLVWMAEDNLPGVPSPICDGTFVFMVDDGGWVTCYDAKKGTKIWEHEIIELEEEEEEEEDEEESLGYGFYSSPSLAGGRLYCTSKRGVTYMFQAGKEKKALGHAKLGDGVYASMAFAPGRIFLRGKKHLFAIGQK